MIIEWLLSQAQIIVTWILDLIPGISQTEVIVSANNIVAPFLEGIYLLGAWLPWGSMMFLMHFVPGVYLFSLFARFFRVILGHIPLIGGNG